MRLGLRDKQVLNDAIFEEMQSQPGFIAVEENLAEVLDRERQEVLQLICFQNPVPDRWQPMAETCHGLKRAPESG